MNSTALNTIVKNQIERCLLTLECKGQEYSSETDRFWNFCRAANILQCSPAQALVGMKVKHDVSILDLVEQVYEFAQPPSRELIDEKFTDVINYTLLLKAMLIEEIENNED